MSVNNLVYVCYVVKRMIDYQYLLVRHVLPEIGVNMSKIFKFLLSRLTLGALETLLELVQDLIAKKKAGV